MQPNNGDRRTDGGEGFSLGGTTPPQLVARISALLRNALDSPDTRERLRIRGVDPQVQSSDQFREKVRSEIERWGPVIERAGIKGLP